MSNAIVRGSISDMAKKRSQSLAETFLNVDAIAVVDISGSMGANDAPGGLSRWETANKHLTHLQGKYPGKIALVEFHSYVSFRPDGKLSSPDMTTALHDALEFVHIADDTGIKIIVISDGMPDNPGAALEMAQKFKSKIDAIYCGAEDDYEGGRSFLQKLTAATGGKIVTSDSPGMIEDGLETLLLGG